MKVSLKNISGDMVTIYAEDRQAAIEDQTVLGSRWEAPSDLNFAYTIIDDQKGLVALLEKEGYEVDDSEYFPMD